MDFRVALLNEAATGKSQDRVETLDLGGVLVAAQADGAGGMGGGAVAAETAVRLALESARRIDPRDASAWSAALAETDTQLEAHPDGGETTLVVAAVWDGGLAGASAGDSGALLIRNTVVHLTENQHRRPLLGTGMAMPVPFTAGGEGGTLCWPRTACCTIPQPRPSRDWSGSWSRIRRSGRWWRACGCRPARSGMIPACCSARRPGRNPPRKREPTGRIGV